MDGWMRGDTLRLDWNKFVVMNCVHLTSRTVRGYWVLGFADSPPVLAADWQYFRRG